MLGKWKDMISGAVGKLNGNTDLLEGAAAGSILVGAADGEIDTNEIAVIVGPCEPDGHYWVSFLAHVSPTSVTLREIGGGNG